MEEQDTSTNTNGKPSYDLLPTNGLNDLSKQLQSVLNDIGVKIQRISQKATLAAESAHLQHSASVKECQIINNDARDILEQYRDLETEFAKIRTIGEIVTGFQDHLQLLEQRILH